MNYLIFAGSKNEVLQIINRDVVVLVWQQLRVLDSLIQGFLVAELTFEVAGDFDETGFNVFEDIWGNLH